MTRPRAPAPEVRVDRLKSAEAGVSVPPTRIDGLDGLRAIAVIGVLLYHAEVPWAQGGFLGVDVFFVLSGYLVAGIVLRGFERTGRLGFGRFWSGRLRRLMPAQVTLMAAVTVSMAILHPDELADLRGQVVAGLTGTMNWYLLATEGSYFEQLGRPPVLRHLWSLAVEMQFYLLFPPVLLACLHRWPRRLDIVVGALAAAVVASSAYMAIVFEPGDPSRAYYDTFARLAAPLLGALLAMIWRPGALARGPVARIGPLVGGIGALALAAAVWLMHVADDRSALMYRGGFLLVAVVAASVVAAVVHPRSWLGGRALLGNPILVTIGLRSYGLYLWHWPVFVLLRPGVDVGWSWGVTFWVRMSVTVVLTECCYRLVERPWHLRGTDASVAGVGRRLFQPSGIPTGPRLAALGAATVVVAAVTVLALPHEPNDEIADALTAGQVALDQAATSTSLQPEAAAEVPAAPDDAQRSTAPAEDDAPPSGPTSELVAEDGRVTVVGDSVVLGSAQAILNRFGDRAIIDAKVARQAADVAPVVRQLGVEGRLGTTVVVQVGINGTVTEGDLRAISDAAPGRRLIVINGRVPRSWQDGNNTTIRSVVSELPNASVLDWYRASEGNGDWYLGDGVHFNAEGQAEYAEAIAAAVEQATAGRTDGG